LPRYIDGDAAREREDAGVAEVAVLVDLHVLGRVERLVVEPGDRREELPLTLRGGLVELPAPLPSAAEPQPVLDARHRRIVPVRSLGGTVSLTRSGDFRRPYDLQA
jgi:hypothetical protein